MRAAPMRFAVLLIAGATCIKFKRYMDAGLHVDEPAPAALFFFSFLCGHTFVWPVALLGRHVFFILAHLVAAARDARAHCLQTQLCWRRRAAAAR